MPRSVYTASEKATKARLLLKGAKNSYSDTSSIEAQIDRIDERAADRGRREHEAHQRLLSQAKDAVAAAKVAERVAKGDKRQAARKTRQDAEKHLKAVERAGRQ